MNAIDVFLVKSLEWEYEQEWRIIRPLSDAAIAIPAEPYSVCLFAFPPEAVIEVILGSRMQEIHRTAIRDVLKGSPDFSHVQIFDAFPDESEFKLKKAQDLS